MNRHAKTCHAARRTARRRRGTLYVSVLGVTLIVALLGMTAITVGRLQLRAVVDQDDHREARLLARSGVEYGFAWLDGKDDWRSAIASGAEQPATNLGRGTFTWQATDPDGDLADDVADGFTLRGVGRVGRVTAVEEVQVAAQSPGLTCLEAAVHATGEIDLGSSTLNTNQQASSNSKIKMPGSGAKISGHAWSASEIEDPSRVTGLAEAFQSPAREAPGANVFDYYLANGAEIKIGDIPTFAGVHTISTVVLSPASNPFGDTNPEGVYYIDCKGQRLNILWSRIVGTLVLLNAGAESGVTAELQWDPAVPNYPALLVDGDFSFDMTGLFGNHALWEGTLSKNFNPSGTPYEGNTDSDKIDIYPGWINGLVYVSGKIEINDESYFNGAVVAGEVELNQDATFNYSGSFLASPPPGFSGDAGGPQRVSPGTWRHAAY